jgi:tetratricopeptide (TPR) repeat protein
MLGVPPVNVPVGPVLSKKPPRLPPTCAANFISVCAYAGAVGSFERAIEANPRSASAHYELAVVCYENTSDWAAAIYHFEKYLKLDPKSHRTDTVRQLITVCKQELVKGLPLTSLNERELANVRKLVTENTDLKQQLDQLRAQLAQRAGPPAATSSIPEIRTNTVSQAQQSLALHGGASIERSSLPPSREAPQATASARTYIVKAGDTPAAIARTYGVALSSLLNANPEVEPRRMKPGQTLRVPVK